MLDSYIKSAVAEVFESMIFMEIDSGDVLDVTQVELVSDVMSMIGLAGDMKGFIALYFPERVARTVTAGMLGMEIDEPALDDIKDAIGEIGNMIAGGFKSCLISEGKNILLSTPTTVAGTSLKAGGVSGATSIVIPFSTQAGAFHIALKYIRE